MGRASRIGVVAGLLLTGTGCDSSLQIRHRFTDGAPVAFPGESLFARAWERPDGGFHLRFGGLTAAAPLPPPVNEPCALGLEVRLDGYRNEPVVAVVDDAPHMQVFYGHLPPNGTLRGELTPPCPASALVILDSAQRVNEFDALAGRALVEFDDVDVGAGRLVGRLLIDPGSLVANGTPLAPVVESAFSFSVERLAGEPPADEDLP